MASNQSDIAARSWPLTPTDIAQFIRLEQCERQLSLRLRERQGFLRDTDVRPQSISPLLTQSGLRFEQAIEAIVRRRYHVVHLAEETNHHAGGQVDNARVAGLARNLAAGETIVLLQPRLEADLGGWQTRGDLDLLRLERTSDGVLNALIADIKSSTSARMEHRLQVAFYHAMLEWLLGADELVDSPVDLCPYQAASS